MLCTLSEQLVDRIYQARNGVLRGYNVRLKSGLQRGLGRFRPDTGNFDCPERDAVVTKSRS